MKKVYLLFLTAVLVCFMLVGCKTTEPESSSSIEPVVQNEETETPSSPEDVTASASSDNSISYQQLDGGWAYKGDDGNSFAQLIFSGPTTFIYAYGAHAGGGDTVMGTFELNGYKIVMHYSKAFVDNPDVEEKTLECEITLKGDLLTFKYLSGEGMDDYLNNPGDELSFESGTVV